MTLLDSWMPTHDVSARYSVRIGAPPAQVYATLLSTDFSRPWLVRGLMGARLFRRCYAHLAQRGGDWSAHRWDPAPRSPT